MQNFLPKPGTAMRGHEPCPPEEHLRAIALARLVLPAEVHVQAPPNLSDADRLGDLLDAGIDDWGGVSPVTPDHVNPERPWPAIDLLREATEERGLALAPRLTIYPEYAAAPARWLDRGHAPSRCSTGPTPSRSAATTRAPSGPSGTRRPPTSAPAPRWCRSADGRPGGTPARTCRHPPCFRPADRSERVRAARWARCWPGCAPGRSPASPSWSRCSGRAARRSRPSPRWPTSSARPRWATPSPTWSTATSTTPTSAPTGAPSAGSARGRCR